MVLVTQYRLIKNDFPSWQIPVRPRRRARRRRDATPQNRLVSDRQQRRAHDASSLHRRRLGHSRVDERPVRLRIRTGVIESSRRRVFITTGLKSSLICT